MLTQEDLLQKEKFSLLQHMKSRECTFHRDTYPNSKKDANVSTSLRKQGNVLYLQFQKDLCNIPNTNGYIDAWIKYTESILYAPNNSEELALGYGNRSAVMFYLRAFDKCIVECDRALSITSHSSLKFKLLCRKAESLFYLDEPHKEVCYEALDLLGKLNLETTKKNYYARQLFTLCNAKLPKSEPCGKKNYTDALLKFERSQEVSCASKSVSVQYRKKWGRHIIATEDIPIGTVIAVENFFSNKYDYTSYTCCNNCTIELNLINSLPCEHCVFNLYCSESCRKDAWDKYHQFQCPVTPILNFVESIEGTSEMGLKFILLAVHQVGGLDQMKHRLLEIENTDDPRTKGFVNGTFQDGKLINFFCLERCKEDLLEKETRLAYMENSCLCAYLLAIHTTFFGEKLNLLETDIFLNQDILFTAALFLRFYYIGQRNMNLYKFFNNGKVKILEHYAPFGGLFNHSCNPNVKGLLSYKVFYVARYHIKKGSQLFLSYDNNIFNHKDKITRQKNLQKKHNFTCDCIACREDWSLICLPSLEYVSEIVPSLQTSLPLDKIFKLMKSLPKYISLGYFDPKVAKKLIHALKLLSKNFTVHCEEYFVILRCLDLLLSMALTNIAINATVPVCVSIFNA